MHVLRVLHFSMCVQTIESTVEELKASISERSEAAICTRKDYEAA